MITKVYEKPDIFKIDVPLPNNPLKNLNCYVVRDGEESLIVDTGFNRPECKEALLEGLEELSVDWEKTDLFLTHLHSDHTGLTTAIMDGKPGKIYMSEKDHMYLGWFLEGKKWEDSDHTFRREGFTEEQVTWLRHENPARGFEPEHFFPAEIVKDGTEIQVGDYSFTCVLVPGHTPGQCCLYCPEEKLMLTADHVLFDITPNITFWEEVPDSLGDYMDSLVKIKQFEVKTALPAHRKNEMDFRVRVDEIIEHHLVRLEETVDAVAAFPHGHATQIGSLLKWSMRGKAWDEFPLSQRWFAVGETLSHLDYLICRGLVKKSVDWQYNSYRLTKTAKECKEKLREIWVDYRR